jgi:hypothetical protein
VSSQEAELKQITYFSSNEFLLKVFGTSAFIKLVIDATYWSTFPERGARGVDGQVCQEYLNWFGILAYCWMIVFSLIAVILLLKIWNISSSKPLKAEILAQFSLSSINTSISFLAYPDITVWVQILGYIAYLGIFFYLPLRKEMLRLAVVTPLPKEEEASQYMEFKALEESFDDSRAIRRAVTFPMFEQYLENGEFVQVFKSFLESEFCLENLIFWQAVQEFKLKRERNELLKARECALSILEQFVLEGATLEVNLSFKAKSTLRSLNTQDPEFPKEDLFDDSHREISLLMFKDPFARFKQTSAFEKIQRSLDSNQMHIQ